MTETLSPIGFWSYARQDDEEKLSGLRSILQRQLQQKYGREPIKIFQDVAAIPPGADWNNKITEALHSSTFLIPIITPNFLESEWCNQEFFLFLEREAAIAKEFPELAASKRIFPIFYIDITDVEAFNPQLLPKLRERQWTNFRDLIYKEDTHESVRLRLDQIAESIVKVLRQDQRAVKERKLAAEASQAAAQQAASQRQAEEVAAAQQIAAEQKPHEAEAREAAARHDLELEVSATTSLHPAPQTPTSAGASPVSRGMWSPASSVAAQPAIRQPVRRQPIELSPATEKVAKRTGYVIGVLILVVAVPLGYGIIHEVLNTGSHIVAPTASDIFGQASQKKTQGDYSAAAPLFQKACDGGIAAACYDLGVMYQKGNGVASSDAQAAALYQKSCDGGFASGCANLGYMYSEGKGVSLDDSQAIALFKKACDAGVAKGCANLGIMYENGRGLMADKTEAVALYRKSCDGGFAPVCSTLGNMYETGSGVPRNMAQAIGLYRQACDGGDADGCADLKRLQH